MSALSATFFYILFTVNFRKSQKNAKTMYFTLNVNVIYLWCNARCNKSKNYLWCVTLNYLYKITRMKSAYS